MDSEHQVLLQNARFYEAFERKDLDAIDRVWSHEDYVKCVHPGWSVLVGWPDVRRSWAGILESGTEMKFSLRNVRASLLGSLAIVVLEEEITFVSGTIEQTQSIMATNIFEYDGTSWRMIHHHGSPVLPPSAPSEEQESDRFRYN